MNKEQQQVKDFMIKADQECPEKPTIPLLAIRMLRVRLMAEELIEFADACGVELNIGVISGVSVFQKSPFNVDLTLAYDAILDLEVVNIGNAVAFGLDLEPGFAEVHRSNMSKFIDGYKREDGKWCKGTSFSPPDLARIILIQAGVLRDGSQYYEDNLP